VVLGVGRCEGRSVRLVRVPSWCGGRRGSRVWGLRGFRWVGKRGLAVVWFGVTGVRVARSGWPAGLLLGRFGGRLGSGVCGWCGCGSAGV
jgi:hypothetical protein